jgi:hypothetical protein
MTREEYKQKLRVFYEDNLQATHQASCQLTDGELREIQHIRFRIFHFLTGFSTDAPTDS